MAAIEKLIYQQSCIEEKVKLLQKQLSCNDATKPPFVLVKKYERELLHYYNEYQRLHSAIMKAVPAARYEKLDEDLLRFDDIHTNSCVLVENLLLLYPSSDNNSTSTRSSYYLVNTRAPRWRTPRLRSRSPSRTTEQPVPVPYVTEKPDTLSPIQVNPEQPPFLSPPNEMKMDPKSTNPIQSVEPPSDEIPTKKIDIPLKFTKTSIFAGTETGTLPVPKLPLDTNGSFPVPQPFRNEADSNPMPQQPQPVTRCRPVLHLVNAVGYHLKLPDASKIPPKIKSSRTAPQVPPDPKRSLLHREIPSVKQPVSKSAGSCPSIESALTPTSAHPVSKPIQIPAGTSPVIEPPEKLWIMVDTHFDPLPICVYEYFHADLKQKKAPD